MGDPIVDIGVVITGDMIVTTARVGLEAAGGATRVALTVRALAADDHRWRGAKVRVLAGDVALLGAAQWIEQDGLDALADLLHERHAVTGQELDVAITAQPLDEDVAAVVAEWAGTPAFSEAGMLVGFLARSTGPTTVVRRVDHLVGARRRHARRVMGKILHVSRLFVR